jgi:nucleoside-diphosphate-sugar epimerase
VLIVGCGDVGLRCAALLRDRYRVFALTSHAQRRPALRAAGVVPIVGDLDAPRSLRRLAPLSRAVLHLAPPQAHGADDHRTRALIAALTHPQPRRSVARAAAPDIVPEGLRRLRALATARRPKHARFAAALAPSPRRRPRIVYASTTGVYGDCGGALIDETRLVSPGNARAVRRVAAERRLRAAGARRALRPSIVRIPGIYAENRLPIARLEKGTPALRDDDDVYTGHIHADDLAAIMVRALTHGRPQRVVHAVDGTRLKMGAYFDLVADARGLRRPPRITRAQAEQLLEPTLLSFMRESRQLSNRRIGEELKVRLRYPTVDAFFGKRRQIGAS